MATIELLPDPAAWKIVQRIVSRINPKVTQVDINQLNNPAFVRSPGRERLSRRGTAQTALNDRKRKLEPCSGAP
jgi:hypothetical protein